MRRFILATTALLTYIIYAWFILFYIFAIDAGISEDYYFKFQLCVGATFLAWALKVCTNIRLRSFRILITDTLLAAATCFIFNSINAILTGIALLATGAGIIYFFRNAVKNEFE
ncbi:hypothetical protein ACE38W_13275 [Chitinophaga sp. Hz27]|uniref:hypothetical protein n=1 Tax=Chitinophaga sp. Hz27 TaxID=3347169 RepID=UPI0035E3044C